MMNKMVAWSARFANNDRQTLLFRCDLSRIETAAYGSVGDEEGSDDKRMCIWMCSW